MVEGAGGPSWYTEYNVLAGLSVRSYGRFAESVTRIAAGRVQRGLPYALRRCGYKTFSLYSWFGAFVGARGFQTTTGIEHFLDARQLRHRARPTPTRFFYDHAAEVMAREQGGEAGLRLRLSRDQPLSLDLPLSSRPGAATGDPGNSFEIDEYLRRQEMSARDYAQFPRAARPASSPTSTSSWCGSATTSRMFAKHFLEPRLDRAAVAQRILHFDPRYFTTYYAIDAVNFRRST